MKQVFTFTLTILFSNLVLAQAAKKIPVKLDQHHTFVSGMLQKQVKREFKNKSGKMESLMAQSTRDNTGDSLIDSVKLMYGPVDTSIYDYNALVYPFNYPYSTTPMFNNNLGNHTSPMVWFSAYYHWTVDPNTLSYIFYQEEFRDFDIHKNVSSDTALYADSSFIPNMTYDNNFNVSSVTSSYAFTYQAGKSDSAYKQFFTYTAGNLTKDSIYEYSGGKWHLVSKTLYAYNISNDLIEIDSYSNPTDTTFTKPLIEQFQYFNFYDGSHRLLNVYEKQYDGANLTPYVTDTFAYTGAYMYHTSWKEYQYDGINKYWAPITYMTKHVNASGLPDTVNIQAFDSLANQWVPYTLDIVKYDSVNNPDSLLAFEYNFTAFPATPNFTTVYYYNYVSDPNSVNNISAANNNITVYPNPAHENITLSGISNKNPTVWVNVYDMQGRMCGKQEIAVKDGNVELPVDYLVPGLYMLTLQDGAGAMLSRKLVVKE
jgi:hypothetical protein